MFGITPQVDGNMHVDLDHVNTKVNTNGNSEENLTFKEVQGMIVSECLAYISHNIHKYAVDTVRNTAANFYTASEIAKAKEHVCNIELSHMAPILRQKRIGQNKQYREIDDIIAFFQIIDEKDLWTSIPDFLAKDLDRLPRATVEHENMSSLLSRLSMLENQMQDITKQNVDLSSDLSRVKQQISQPIIPQKTYSSVSQPHVVLPVNNNRRIYRNVRLTSLADSAATDIESDGGEYIPARPPKRLKGDLKGDPPKELPKRKPVAKGTSAKSGLSGGNDCFNVFVYHVEKGQGCDAVKSFMEGEGIHVFKIDKVSHLDARLESFCVNVERSKYDTLCGEGAADFWPCNIRCRPYNKPRTNETGGKLYDQNKNTNSK